jgi:ribosomal protein S18 acetylase RimI-like enzyme
MIIKFNANTEVPQSYLEQLADFDLWMDREECSPSLQYDKVYLFLSDENVAGFQTINDSSECLGIEVKEEFRGQGIARKLIEESGSCVPHPMLNDNPIFWDKIAEEN